jgi:hypothetical protein
MLLSSPIYGTLITNWREVLMSRYGYDYRQNFFESLWDQVPDSVKEALGWLLAISVFGFAVYLASLAGGKLAKIIYYNPGFWVAIVLSFFFGLYRKLTNPYDFTWRELPIHLVVSFISIVLLFSLFFVTSTDIWDKEIRNGYVQGAEYWEAWTERTSCNHKDKKGRQLHSHHTEYHSPQWILKTVNIDDLRVSSSVYNNYVNRWSNNTYKHIFRPSQISFGDGNMYYTTYNHDVSKYVPASEEYSFVNYLQASHETLKRRFSSVDLFAEYKKPYPRVYAAGLGPIEVDRIVLAGAPLPPDYAIKLDRELDVALATLGAKKQVNVLLYFTGGSDVGAGLALEEHWIKGKKNDVIVFVGAKNFPKVDWVHVSAWTENEEFKINLRNKILGLKKEEFSNPNIVARTILDQIDLPSPTGFQRMPMEKLEYLIGDIRLPLWSQILIVVLAGLANWFCSAWLIRERVV